MIAVNMRLTHSATGMEAVADLANDNAARGDSFATEPLDAAALGIRIASVAAGALSLFMSHGVYSVEAPQGRKFVGRVGEQS